MLPNIKTSRVLLPCCFQPAVRDPEHPELRKRAGLPPFYPFPSRRHPDSGGRDALPIWLLPPVNASCEAKRSSGLSLGLHGGAVSVGATETALHCLLLDRLALFQKEHPDVKIRISNGTTAHMLSDLKEGRTDVAVVPTPLQIEKPYSTVRLRPVRSILVGGPRFSALMDKPISLQELIQYPLAGLTEATMSHQFYENFFAAHGLPLNYDIELASADPAAACCQP